MGQKQAQAPRRWEHDAVHCLVPESARSADTHVATSLQPAREMRERGSVVSLLGGSG